MFGNPKVYTKVTGVKVEKMNDTEAQELMNHIQRTGTPAKELLRFLAWAREQSPERFDYYEEPPMKCKRCNSEKHPCPCQEELKKSLKTYIPPTICQECRHVNACVCQKDMVRSFKELSVKAEAEPLRIETIISDPNEKNVTQEETNRADRAGPEDPACGGCGA